MIIPVILCGGVGSRLWPLSREDNPKQFLKINGNAPSLFQETVLRVSEKNTFLNPIIVCGQKYKFKVATELEEINIKPYAILLEPCSKNTAPAISAAAMFIRQQFSNGKSMLVLPADHIIKDDDKFVACVKKFKKFSNKGMITFGITPTHPATGYGYIKIGDKLENGIHSVKSFIEKPNKARAEKFIENGEYFWNSGMFLMDNQLYLEELEKINPGMFALAGKALDTSKKVFDFIELDDTHFSKLEDVSIDTAIFEKTIKSLLCPVKINWLDIGSWEAFYAYKKRSADKEGNVVLGDKVHTRNCKNTLLHSECDGHLIANGLANACVIHMQDAVLITTRDDSEGIKEIYSHLKKSGVDITQSSNKSYRPWGYYEVILDDANCKVKRICITPRQQISLQYHDKRSEHWVITKGVATVTKGNRVSQLEKNESVYISIKEVHKIANNTAEPLEFIEVQIGKDLSEKDIVRIEDKYKRNIEAYV